MEIPDYLVISCVAAGAQALAHFFPWRALLRRDLHKVEAYVIGTAIILSAQLFMASYRLLGVGDVLMPAVFSGAVVVIAYGFDMAIEARDAKALLEKYERVIKEGEEK